MGSCIFFEYSFSVSCLVRSASDLAKVGDAGSLLYQETKEGSSTQFPILKLQRLRVDGSTIGVRRNADMSEGYIADGREGYTLIGVRGICWSE